MSLRGISLTGEAPVVLYKEERGQYVKIDASQLQISRLFIESRGVQITSSVLSKEQLLGSLFAMGTETEDDGLAIPRPLPDGPGTGTSPVLIPAEKPKAPKRPLLPTGDDRFTPKGGYATDRTMLDPKALEWGTVGATAGVLLYLGYKALRAAVVSCVATPAVGLATIPLP